MAPPRPSREPVPPSTSQVGGGSASDKGYEIFERLGGIERSITYLEARSSDSDRKLDALTLSIQTLTKEVSDAKAAFAAVQPVIKGIGKALWGILGSIILFLLSILGMWLKHHNGW